MKQFKVNTVSQQIHKYLQDAILHGEYEPEQWLQETKLAEELNVSRSPVREALRLLVADGLAVEIPNKGVFVRKITCKDVRNIFQYRQAIEGYAIYQITPNLDDKMRKKFERFKDDFLRYYEDEDLDNYILVDRQYHRYLIECLDNSLMLEEYDRVSLKSQQFRIYSLESKKRFNESIEEHCGTIDYILKGDFKSARKKNCEHLKLANDVVQQHFENE